MTGFARLLLIRFRDIPMQMEADLIARTQQIFEGQPGVLQTRVVRNDAKLAGEYAILVEATQSIIGSIAIQDWGNLASCIEVLNEYTPYWNHASVPSITQQ